MSALAGRRTQLAFETRDEIRERGQYRPVCVEAHPDFAVLRLKGTRHRLTLTWAAMYSLAAKQAADQARRDRKAKKAGDL